MPARRVNANDRVNECPYQLECALCSGVSVRLSAAAACVNARTSILATPRACLIRGTTYPCAEDIGACVDRHALVSTHFFPDVGGI